MKISEHIASLQKILDEGGPAADQELFMWVTSDDGTSYMVLVPELKIVDIDTNQYQVSIEHRDGIGTIPVIMNLDSESFNEDRDCCQDLSLNII